MLNVHNCIWLPVHHFMKYTWSESGWINTIETVSPETFCFSGADFSGVVRFGVVTNEQVAGAISLKEDESVYLYRTLNSSLVSGQPITMHKSGL